MHIDPIRATGEAMPAAQPDPLFQLILDYARARDFVNANEDSSDEQFELDMIQVYRLRGRMTNNPPASTTANGAAAVLRLIAADLDDGDFVNYHAPVVAAVLAFLTKRWEDWPEEVLPHLAS